MDTIEVVITNWKRSCNYEKILESLRGQTIPCTITICDCHPSEEYALSASVLSGADRIYRWGHNLGGYNRYAPIGAYDHQYTFFMDDDILPGKKCLEFFLETALNLNNEFGVLGQYGRLITGGNKYVGGDVARESKIKEVDFIVQAYFVKTSNLYSLLKFKWEIGYFDDKLPHDDLLLGSSLKYYHDLRCYLLPLCSDPEKTFDRRSLNNDYAHCSLPDHYQLRQQFINRIIFYGWKPLHITGEKHIL